MYAIPPQSKPARCGLLCLFPQPAATCLVRALAIQPCAYVCDPQDAADGLARLRQDRDRGLLPQDAPLLLAAPEAAALPDWPGPVEVVSVWHGDADRCPPGWLACPMDGPSLTGLAWLLLLLQQKTFPIFSSNEAKTPFRLRFYEQRAGAFQILAQRKRRLALQSDRQTKADAQQLTSLLESCCQRYCQQYHLGWPQLSLSQTPLSWEGFQSLAGGRWPPRQVLSALLGQNVAGLYQPPPVNRELVDFMLMESALLDLPLAWLAARLPRYAAQMARKERTALDRQRRALDQLAPIQVPKHLPASLETRLAPLETWRQELRRRQLRLAFWQALAEGVPQFTQTLEQRLRALAEERQLLELAHPSASDFPAHTDGESPWTHELVRTFLQTLDEPGLLDARTGGDATLLLPPSCLDHRTSALSCGHLPLRVLPTPLEEDRLILLLRLPIFPKEA